MAYYKQHHIVEEYRCWPRPLSKEPSPTARRDGYVRLIALGPTLTNLSKKVLKANLIYTQAMALMTPGKMNVWDPNLRIHSGKFGSVHIRVR